MGFEPMTHTLGGRTRNNEQQRPHQPVIFSHLGQRGSVLK